MSCSRQPGFTCVQQLSAYSAAQVMGVYEKVMHLAAAVAAARGRCGRSDLNKPGHRTAAARDEKFVAGEGAGETVGPALKLPFGGVVGEQHRWEDSLYAQAQLRAKTVAIPAVSLLRAARIEQLAFAINAPSSWCPVLS